MKKFETPEFDVTYFCGDIICTSPVPVPGGSGEITTPEEEITTDSVSVKRAVSAPAYKQ